MSVLDISDAQRARIQALRNSNENAIGQERQEITDFSTTLRQASNDMASRIVTLKAELARVEQEKAEADALLDDISAVLHPLRRFHPEVLSEIFNAATQSFPTPTWPDFWRPTLVDSLHRSYPAWVLSRVSSSWRRAALGTPSIWSTVILTLDSNHWRDNGLNMSFLLATFLSRSGNRAIALHLGCGRQSIFQNHPIFPTLLMTCHRWEYAFILLPWTDHAVFESVPGPFSLLKTIQIPFEAIPPPNWTCNAFNSSQAPQLGQVITNLSAGILAHNMPCSQIHTFRNTLGRHMDIKLEAQEANLQLLKAMPSVQTLNLFAALPMSAPTPPIPITFPNLQTLSIIGHANAVQDLGARIHAPALVSLQLLSNGRFDQVVTPGTPLAFRSRACKRVVLCMRLGDDGEVAALEWLLRQMPGINSLEIRFISNLEDIEGICKALTARGQQTLGTGLESITLIGYAEGFNVSERLLTMISSRRAGVQAVQILKRIVLHTVRDCSVDIMISLAEMSSTGLDVEIKHS